MNQAKLNSKQASLERLEAQEIWHKLVVKVISWRDGSGGAASLSEKITPSEWKTYSEKFKKNNTSYSTQKVTDLLKEIKTRIEEHGGFAEKATK